MSVAAYMCSLSVVLAVALFGAFLWLTRGKRCPCCGNRTWNPLPGCGRYVVGCSRCAYLRDLAEGE